MTTMLASIVGAAVGHSPDLAIAGRSAPGVDLADQIRRCGADVLVLQSAQAEQPREIPPLLERFPRLKVLAITDDCHAGFLHELRPIVTRLGDISAQSLADALRGGSPLRLN